MYFVYVCPLFFVFLVPALAVDWADPTEQVTCTCSSVSSSVCMSKVCQTQIPKQSACFPGSGQVILSNGSKKSLSDIQYGDLVLVGDGTFEEVLDFIHANRDQESQYLRIETQKSMEPLLISANHLIFLFKNKNDEAIFAGNLHVGDHLKRILDNGQTIADEIVDIQLTTSIGYYAPLTPSGTIVVNGIVASNYAVVSNHRLAHQTMSVYRLWIRIFGPILLGEKHEQENIHWLLQGMENLAHFPIVEKLADNTFFDGTTHLSTLK
ncbi:unnamed protein product [Rotaria magnacalcarata]|uniref:Uncharacterized protein n=2 Tax=Rotaria magnacalcarata TaxID=392030 RepID=A0A816VXC4_9BILA|nr:unnamed protein product [Rotaria magnacalcarata]